MRNVAVHLYTNCLKQIITQPKYALTVEGIAVLSLFKHGIFIFEVL